MAGRTLRATSRPRREDFVVVEAGAGLEGHNVLGVRIAHAAAGLVNRLLTRVALCWQRVAPSRDHQGTVLLLGAKLGDHFFVQLDAEAGALGERNAAAGEGREVTDQAAHEWGGAEAVFDQVAVGASGHPVEGGGVRLEVAPRVRHCKKLRMPRATRAAVNDRLNNHFGK